MTVLLCLPDINYSLNLNIFPMEILVEVVGWLGSSLVITAYFLNMQGLLPAHSPRYRWLNIIGSGCLIVLTMYHGALPAAAENAIWMAIGVVALVRARK